jgi:hypothetical protein
LDNRLNGQSTLEPHLPSMDTWHGHTPDGHELVVRRERDSWTVRCGINKAHSRILDVALIEAIRADSDLVAHAREIDYAARIRAQADRIEEELGQPD